MNESSHTRPDRSGGAFDTPVPIRFSRVVAIVILMKSLIFSARVKLYLCRTGLAGLRYGSGTIYLGVKDGGLILQ